MAFQAQDEATHTESLCPVCLRLIPASRVPRGDDVFLEKTCPDHGAYSVAIWRGEPSYTGWARPKVPWRPVAPATEVKAGCPFDCGLCPDHRQQTCTALIEVTLRCDLGCAYCFADAPGSVSQDPEIGLIRTWYERLLTAGHSINVQLSGGEPTIRDDLAEIVALGRSLGFGFIQLNTNGHRLAMEPAYVESLRSAGLGSVFLQFDGTDDQVYQRLRGRRLFDVKLRAIENCRQQDLGVVLVPTLVPEVNTDSIGSIIQFALDNVDVVRGVHFQPVSYFGRFPRPPSTADRITIPEAIRAIERQTSGRLRAEHFKPPGCENAYCSFHGNFVLMRSGDVVALTKHTGSDCCCGPAKAEEGAARTREHVAKRWASPERSVPSAVGSGLSLGFWDELIEAAATRMLSISGMAFQDAWTIDLERLRDCCIHVVTRDGRLVPFCAYNLTSRDGRPLYGRRV